MIIPGLNSCVDYITAVYRVAIISHYQKVRSKYAPALWERKKRYEFLTDIDFIVNPFPLLAWNKKHFVHPHHASRGKRFGFDTSRKARFLPSSLSLCLSLSAFGRNLYRSHNFRCSARRRNRYFPADERCISQCQDAARRRTFCRGGVSTQRAGA